MGTSASAARRIWSSVIVAASVPDPPPSRRRKVERGDDLDADNLPLLRRGQLHVLLHHDLQHDMRAACRHVMRAHGAGGDGGVPGLSAVQVVTPFNIPQ